jgi:antitoxin VapB
MALSIKDRETDELARKLASQTGETITEAIKNALRERLARERGKRARAGLSGRLLKIGQRCSLHLGEPGHSLDHGDLLYDKQGLPK